MTTQAVAPATKELRSGPLAFAIPALTFSSVTVGGRLYVAELLVLLVLPVLVFSHRSARLRDPFSTAFFKLAALWFTGQALTDIVRGTPVSLLVRGWSLIIFTAVNFAVLWLLIRTRRHVLLAIAGVAIGSLLEFGVSPSTFSLADPWKFGYGYGITLGVVVAAAALRLALPACLVVLASLAVVNALQGFRSLGGICLAAAGTLFLQRTSAMTRNFSPARLGLVIVALIATAYFVLGAYSFAASEGHLGEQAAEKHREQAGALGPLVGGRREVVFAAVAIRQSPFIGHGSWAQRTYEIDDIAIDFLNRHNYSYFRSPEVGIDANVIPAHSHLLGPWVTAGVLAVPFWIWAFWTSLAGVTTRFSAPATGALAAMLSCTLFWDIFFSPFGATRRITVPLFLIALVVLRRTTPLPEPQLYG